MPASSLPTEILEDIVKNFSQNQSCLFSCALVHRSWCVVAIPILCQNPLEFCDMVSPFCNIRYQSLLATYFKCFDEEQKKRVLENKDLDLDTLSKIDAFFKADRQHFATLHS